MAAQKIDMMGEITVIRIFAVQKTNIPFHSIVRRLKRSNTKIKYRNIFLYLGLKTR